MTEATQQTAPTEAAPAPANTPGDGAADLDARIAALKADDGNPSGAPIEAPPAAVPVEVDAATKRSEERRARLAALSEQMRAKVDARRPQPSDEMAQKYAEAQRRAQELEAAQAKLVDPSKLDAAGFFKLANQMQVSPQDLGEYLRTATLNPEIVAAQAAQKALDPRIAAAEERAARAESLVQQFLQQQEKAQAQQAAQAQMHAFVGSINAEESPRAATFLKAFGPNEFLRIAESAADGLPANAGRQALLDVIEENLESLARAFIPDTTSSAKQTTTPTPAAAKAITVSNAHAQVRASVVDDDDWASLPLEERAARLKASL